MRRTAYLTLAFLGAALPMQAGVHNPAEKKFELAADLSQFLGQLAQLRGYGPPDFSVARETKQRQDYLAKVEQLRRKGRRTADEHASLGAYLIYLRMSRAGAPPYEEAIRALEEGRREHPRDFRILANLATAYQLIGQLDNAQRLLFEADSLAPPEHRPFERAHLTLVTLRLREKIEMGRPPLDPLFPARFIGPGGEWEVGKIADTELQKFPGASLSQATQTVQQLLIWLPDDGRLHWLLGELANAQGDLKAAYQAMNTAFDMFRISTPELMKRRQLLREAIAQATPKPPTIEFGEEGDAEPRESLLASFGPGAWTIVGLGAFLILLLLLFQAREIYRRRKSALVKR